MSSGRSGGGSDAGISGKFCGGSEVRISGRFGGEIRDRLDGGERVKRVITIENLTTYFRWQEEDGLLVYLGGYHNGVRRGLLREIYASFPEAVYYHFGDIDAGGFEMYRDLREKTGIPFRMYHMDLETLQKYEAYGKRLTENDRKRLLVMRGRAELTEIIDYMPEHEIGRAHV